MAGALQPSLSHERFIPHVLELLSELLPSDMVSYNELALPPHGSEQPPQTVQVVWSPAAPSGGLSVDDQRRILSAHLRDHPAQRPHSHCVARNRDLPGAATWSRSELYNQLYRPLRLRKQCHLYVPPARPRSLMILSYSRESGAFHDKDVRLLERAQAIFADAFRQHWAQRAMSEERTLWRLLGESDERGLVLLSQNVSGGELGAYRLDWANSRAHALLRAIGLPLSASELPAPLRAWLRPLAAGRVPTRPLRLRADSAELSISCHRSSEHASQLMLCLRQAKLAATELDEADAYRAIAAAYPLTAREAQVAWWICQGKNNPDIATILGIRPATVKKHTERIYFKLGVENRTSLASTILAHLDTGPQPRTALDD